MPKFLIIILSVLFINLQYHLWFGYKENNTLHHKIEEQRKANTFLKKRNETLKFTIADLKQGYEAVEERARMELGMIKRNEVFYHIVE